MTLGELWKEREVVSNETLISSYIQHLQLESSKNEAGTGKAKAPVFMPPAPKKFKNISEMRDWMHENRGFKGKVTPRDG